MALLCKTVSFSTGTGAVASTVPVTGAGFTPKAVIFYWSGRTESVNTNGAASHFRGVGFATGAASRRVVANQSTNAAATSICDAAARSDACIETLLSGGAVDGLLDFTAFTADGCTLTVDDQFGTSRRIHAVFLGGDDIEAADTGIFTEPAAAGSQNFTSFAFKPDFLFFIGEPTGSAQPYVAAHSRICVGFVDQDLNQAVLAGGALGAQATSNTLGYCRSGEAIAQRQASGTAINTRGAVTAMLSNGFTMNFLEVVGTALRQFMVLGIKGGKYKVDSITTRDDTATQTEVVGFTPKGFFSMSGSEPEDAVDTPHLKDEMNWGSYDDSAVNLTQISRDDNAEATTEVSTGINFDNFYMNVQDAGVLDATAAVNGLTQQGFTWAMTNAEPAAFSTFVPYVAFGDNAAFPAVFQNRQKFFNPEIFNEEKDETYLLAYGYEPDTPVIPPVGSDRAFRPAQGRGPWTRSMTFRPGGQRGPATR